MDGRFKPDNSIARGEMDITLDNMLQQSGNYNVLKTPNYKDAKSIGQRAIVAVKRLNNFGIMALRVNNYFKPNDNGTRVETVLSIYNLLKTTGKLTQNEVMVAPEPEKPTAPPAETATLEDLFAANISFNYNGFQFERVEEIDSVYGVDNNRRIITSAPKVNPRLLEFVNGEINNGHGFLFGLTNNKEDNNRTLYSIAFNACIDLTKSQLESAIRQVNGKQKKVAVGNYIVEDATDKYGILLYVRRK
ncbi:hypothetical protein NCCP2716_30980 [Sporosarcina sp. NCCP-2716]|uniref:S-layer homology domain-containing protein n=1 Tax=Sporosarcina sp. NCCP-2716 TaxID=2943679 RepID=UPI00203F5671|nr:S-layer homology domain-containing protein [Sporosarcina sp. NCCP-2716]GKV70600.1 hypothetical protein NCCP2716_30980 [Sporosarcina sp. NCCP-2716]